MKPRTIWTMPGMPLRERLIRTREWLLGATAHRMPRALAYWAFIDVVTRYSREHPHAVVPEIYAADVIKAMDNGSRR